MAFLQPLTATTALLLASLSFAEPSAIDIKPSEIDIKSSAIYKWQDSEGRTQYSDTRPEHTDIQPLKLPPLNVQAAPSRKDTPNTETSPQLAGDPTKAKKAKSRGVIGKVNEDKESIEQRSSSAEYYEDRYPYYYPPYPRYRYNNPGYRDPNKRYRPCKPPHRCERRSDKPYKGDGKHDNRKHDNRKREETKHKQQRENHYRQQYSKQYPNRHYPDNHYGRNTRTSYGEFERPNLYWAPYPYNTSPRWNKR